MTFITALMGTPPAIAQLDLPPADRPAPSDLDRALGHLGLSRDDVRIRQTDLARLTNNQRPGSLLGHLLEEPFAAKACAHRIRTTLLEELKTRPTPKRASPFWSDVPGFDPAAPRSVSAAAIPNVISKLSRWSDCVVRRTLLGNPIQADMEAAAKTGALRESIAALHDRADQPLSPEALGRLRIQTEALPVAVRRAAALLLHVTDRAIASRDRAIRSLDRSALEDTATLAERLEFGGAGGGSSDDDRDRLTRFEVGPLLAASQELALAMAASAALLEGTKLPAVAFDWRTPYGLIRIDTHGPTTYPDDDPYLLIIDTAGDDTYRAGANAVGLHDPVSLLLDTAGNDQYRTAHEPIVPVATSQPAKGVSPIPDQPVSAAFGAAVLGIAILYDAQGDDTYDATQRCMGYGLFGVGVLADLGGNDHYHGVANTQGAAEAGIGLLLDLAGDDRYNCYTHAQGFGYLDGVGCLLDAAGDDRYLANTTDIRFPAAQSSAQNDSLAQGVGCGRRADYLDGHSLPGGVGLLVDGSGDDQYECGIFGQGAGYWFGVGLCIDAAGDDQYAGAWYVQGAAAHFAAGVLLDEDGNDHYTATMATSQGTGHDLSLGFLADLAGDDCYEAANLTMGSGNVAGIGIMVDVTGDDDYSIPPGNTLGNANPGKAIRSTMITFGLFLDGGGNDTYNRPYARDQHIWGNGPDRRFKRFDTLRFAIGLDTTLSPSDIQRMWAPHVTNP